MKFRDTAFWQHYADYTTVRSTVDALILWRVLEAHDFNCMVEIGVFQGHTAGLMLEARPLAHVCGVDPLPIPELLTKYYSPQLSRYTYIQERRADAGLIGQYDFILLDGNHFEAEQDIAWALEHIKPTGILAIDDYRQPDVAQAIAGVDAGAWQPFLRSEQIEYWQHSSQDRSAFVDSLFTDPMTPFVFVDNEIDNNDNVVCTARTLAIFTDTTEFFNQALVKYDI
jgi:hypothetical protein